MQGDHDVNDFVQDTYRFGVSQDAIQNLSGGALPACLDTEKAQECIFTLCINFAHSFDNNDVRSKQQQ